MPDGLPRKTPQCRSAADPHPTARRRQSYGYYLDDPVEQRRYFWRWAFTLIVLGALAVGLIWALGELQEGWGAFLDLFRARPPGSGMTRALPSLPGLLASL